MRRLLPAAGGGRHLEAPQVDTLASEACVGNRVAIAPGLEGQDVCTAASPDVA